jgi:hypothetical protein
MILDDRRIKTRVFNRFLLQLASCFTLLVFNLENLGLPIEKILVMELCMFVFVFVS